jgi:hypothetical protein
MTNKILVSDDLRDAAELLLRQMLICYRVQDVDISITDHDVTGNFVSRAIYTSDAGIVKFDWTDADGVTQTSIRGGFVIHAPNVTKVYKVGTTADPDNIQLGS